MTLTVESYCSRVHREIAAYAREVRAFLQVAECRPYRQPEGVFVAPVNGQWEELDEVGTTQRLNLIANFDEVFDKLVLLYQGLPDDLSDGPAQAVDYVRGLVWRNQSSVAIPSSREQALNELNEQLSAIERLLLLRSSSKVSANRLVIVPDTSALIEVAELIAVAKSVGGDEPVEVVLLMSVIGELDVKKHDKHNKEAAQRARRVLRSIDEVVSASDHPRGAEIAAGVYVRTIVTQPDLGRYGAWARTIIVDDQILASTLDLAAANAGDCVVLATNDLAMRARARALGVSSVGVKGYSEASDSE